MQAELNEQVCSENVQTLLTENMKTELNEQVWSKIVQTLLTENMTTELTVTYNFGKG